MARQKGDGSTVNVSALIEYSWRCPKCGKFNSSQWNLAKCNKCFQQVTLTVKKNPEDCRF